MTMLAGHCLLMSLVLASPESDRARALYAEQRYSEAAVIFEQLWTADKSSSDLFNAALARQAAGELTKANLYFRMISGQSDLGPDERTEAAEHVGWLRQVLTVIEVKIRPGAALGPKAALHLAQGDDLLTVALSDLEETPRLNSEPNRTWTLYLEPGEWTLGLLPRSARHAYNSVDSVEPQRVVVPPASSADLTLTVNFALTPQLAPLEIEVGERPAERGVELRLTDPLGLHSRELVIDRAHLSLPLPTGAWDYTLTLGKHAWLRRPRGPTSGGAIEVMEGTSPTRRSFTAQLEDELDAERRRETFALTTAGTSLLFATVGGGFLGGGSKRRLEDSQNKTGVLDLGSAGAFFLGSAAGLVGTSLGTVLGAGRRVWLAELALGSTTAVTATAWYGLSRRSLPRRAAYTAEESATISERQPLLYASMALVGLGTALSLGAGVSLLLDRARAKRTKSKSAAPNAQVSFQTSISGGGFYVSF